MADLIQNIYVDRIKKTTNFNEAMFHRYNAKLRKDFEDVSEPHALPKSSLESNLPPVVIFPEGTTCNREAMLRFKTGAFRFNLDV